LPGFKEYISHFPNGYTRLTRPKLLALRLEVLAVIHVLHLTYFKLAVRHLTHILTNCVQDYWP
jgi:hypothetical protein